jgi:hypothetical protein
VATSVARIILRPARHFLRTFLVSAIFVSAMSNFRAGLINALQLGRHVPRGRVRENWVVPPGLRSFFPLFPALKRWAKLVRPSGAVFSKLLSRALPGTDS